MKCKITRGPEKQRLKAYRAFFKELEALNPKRTFSEDEDNFNGIKVDTLELYKLNLPGNCAIPEAKKGIGLRKASLRCLAVKYKDERFLIFGW